MIGPGNFKDAVSVIGTGRNCIATLSNDPKWLRGWLNTLPFLIIGLCDGDKAGKKLGNSCEGMLVLPEGQDCNSMSKEELLVLLTNSL